eukprot:CAMPEP_0117795188 /NCGR_PEP_ID=MMETSP0948-20121206/11151_1 /TAXON_ID=44440 /ORGANISM="Chattonella subsalsa, Strain CCMP2191" /LENGTH=60 /DNA_ID=CAMNT_0005626079 /DNA_START=187 /DNA_END=369 /DNA_ORIENTATION=+
MWFTILDVVMEDFWFSVLFKLELNQSELKLKRAGSKKQESVSQMKELKILFMCIKEMLLT